MNCPYCFSELTAAEAVACRTCDTPLHADCARLHGGCVTLGCPGTRFRAGSAVARRRALAPSLGWSTRCRIQTRRALEVALVPAEDVTLAVLGLGGLVGLALLL